MKRIVTIGCVLVGVELAGVVMISPNLRSNHGSRSWTWLNPWEEIVNLVRPSQGGCGGIPRVEADIQNLSAQLEIFEVMAGRFPTESEGLNVMLKESFTESGRRISQLLEMEPLDRWSRPYQYRQPAMRSQSAYDLFSLGPDGIPSADDVGNW